jgi:hypothetical protein
MSASVDRPRKKKPAAKVRVSCTECGGFYFVHPRRLTKTKFCSYACGGAARFREMHAIRRRSASSGQMKVCSRCGLEKPYSEFFSRSGNKDGLRGKCKSCCGAQSKAWRDANADRKSAYDHDYYVANKEEIATYNAARYTANKEGYAARNQKWREQNPEKSKEGSRRRRREKPEIVRAAQRHHYRKNKGRYVAQARAREELIKRATPPWANLKAIERFYVEAERLTRVTGIKHHVDHFYPLQGKMMCGLHVEANLRVVPALVNLRKSNRIEEAVGAPLCCAWPAMVTSLQI